MQQPRTFSVKRNNSNVYSIFLLLTLSLFNIHQATSQCLSISTLTCSEVTLSTPLSLQFDGTEGGLLDGSNTQTGFTMVMAPSSRLSVDDPVYDLTVPGYEPALLSVMNGSLNITSTKGIFYYNLGGSTETNSQINALGAGFDASLAFRVSTEMEIPDFSASAGNNAQQGGLWFGLDEDNVIKLAIAKIDNTNAKIQLVVEANGDPTGGIGVAELNNATINHTQGGSVKLTLEFDPITNKVSAYYELSTGGEILLSQNGVSDLNVPPSFFTGIDHDGNTGTANVSYAGLFSTHRRAAAAETLNFIFNSFDITPDRSLTFTPLTISETLEEGSNSSMITSVLSTSDASNTTFNLSTVSGSSWLALPSSPSLGSIDLAVDATGLSPGVYTEVILAAAQGYKTAELEVTLTVILPSDLEARINFQDDASVPPSNFVKDYGKEFGNSSISFLGSTRQYGWKQLSNGNPLDISGELVTGSTGAGRNRISVTYGSASDQDKLEGTLVHFQGDNIGSWSGQPRGNEVYWELEVPNGTYEVTIGLGDKSNSIDSRHSATLEGYTIIPAFAPTSGETRTETMIVSVTDGLLTMNGQGGFNSKITHITVKESTGTPVSGTLAFTPSSTSESLAEGSVGSFTSDLSGAGASDIGVIINDDEDGTNDWLTLPGSFGLGTLNFATDASSLVQSDVRDDQIIATAKGFTPATLDANLQVTAPLSNANDIESFSLAAETGPAVIDGGTHTVTIEVANGTILSSLVPTITVSASATILPLTGEAQDFSSPFLYTVTAEDGTDQEWTINVTVEGPSLYEAYINFQDNGTIPPSGYSKDYGKEYGNASITNDVGTFAYGWKQLSDGLPIDASDEAAGNVAGGVGRNRISGTYSSASDQDKLEGTLVHFQGDNVLNNTGGTQAWAGTPRGNELFWEIEVPNGLYEVTLGLGDKDGSNLDSRHSATIEGYTIIPSFAPNPGEVKTETMIVSVSDGFLTMNGLGGYNSKITHIEIVESAGTPVNGILTFSPTAISSNLVAGTSAITSSTLAGAGAGTLGLVIDDNINAVDKNLIDENDWLTLPGSISLGSLDFLADAADLNSGDTRANKVIATAKGFTPATLDLDLQVTAPLSDEKDILTFALTQQAGPADINQTAKTVQVEVVNGTPLTALEPVITVSTSAAISPQSGDPQDFSSPVVYTVTAEDGSTVDWTVTVSIEPASVVIPYRMNVAGSDYTKDGDLFLAENANYLVETSTTTTSVTAYSPYTVPGGHEDLYYPRRYGPEFSYNIPITNGNYKVALHMVENFQTAIGARIFDVSIEGNTVIDDIDLYAEAGKGALVLLDFPVTVSDSELNIDFLASANNAIVQAIEILPLSGANDIEGFALAEQTGPATIDGGAHTVAITVPFGTDVTNLEPTIIVSEQATISPASGVAQDFSSPLTYTVTAEDNMTQDWIVTVTELSCTPPSYVVSSSAPPTCGGNGTLEITGLLASNTYVVSTDGGSTTSSETSDGSGVIFLSRVAGTYNVQVSLAGCAGAIEPATINAFVSACSPVSYLTNLEVSLPYVLDFSTDHGQLADGSGNGTGFTAVMEHSENRSAGDLPISCPDMNGYEPSLLTLNTVAGQLEVVSQAGISYLDPPASSNNNNQVNTLGVGLKALAKKIIIKTTLIDIVTGGSSAQAGIWFGFDEDNFVKLNLNQNNRIEMRVERGGASENNTTDQLQVTTTVGAMNEVALEMEIDPTTLEVQAFYTIDAGSRTLLEVGAINSLTLPADYFTGRDLTCVNDITFAGIYATHRSGSQFTARFDDFLIRELSQETDITSFTLAEQTGSATIDDGAHTVSVEVPFGTDVSALSPTITVSAGATIDPASGVSQDFSSPFTYTVTSEDNTDQDWIITVTEAPSGANDITAFSFAEQTGGATIDAGGHTVAIEVLNGTVLTSLTPTITVSADATIDPASGVSQDFSSPFTYTVTSEDNTDQDWIITVTEAPSGANDITAFSFAEQTGGATIDAGGHTVAIEVLNGTVLTSLTPTITVSADATIDPASGVSQDFSSPFTYTVTSEDNTDQDWIITVTEAPSGANDITAFSFAEQTGGATIDAGGHTVAIEVLNGTVLTSLTPTITVSADATIDPASGVSQDFSSPFTYTVTSEDNTDQDWIITVTEAPSGANDITAFSFAEQTGGATIDAGGHTVAIEVLNGTVLTSLTPTITVSADATIDPASGVSQDFSSPFTYTVTSEDNTDQDWIITVTEAPSGANDITAFSFAEQTGAATIDAGGHTVAIEVLNGTVLTSLTPTITVSADATIDPASGVSQDFSSPFTYTVTSEDNTDQDWIITVTEAPSGANDITAFSFAEQTGGATIDAGGHTVAIEVLNGTVLTSLTPTITVSADATIDPASGVSQDFSSPFTYTVTSEDNTDQDWIITVTEAPSGANDITAFSFAEQTGAATIDAGGHTVSVEVPFGTDVTALSPTITVSAGATIDPLSGATVDFTNTVNYTVTAEDGIATQVWAVTVSVASNTATDIASFEIGGSTGNVDAINHTVSVEVPFGTDVTSLSPTITVSAGATIDPLSGATVDFTNAVNYTVTAEDGNTTQAWSVTVSVAPCDSPTYTVSGTDPTTCGGNGTILISTLAPSTSYEVSTDGGTNASTLSSDINGEISLTPVAGTYNVVLSLAGCTGSTIPVELTDPSAPTYVVSSTDPTTCGGSGTITISELAAIIEYEVSVDNGSTANALTSDGSGEITLNQPAGSYDLVVSLAGCQGESASVILTDPSAPTYTVSGTDPTTCGGNGTILISTLTPSTSYEVSTDGGTNTSTLSSDVNGEISLTPVAGTYNVVLLLAGCTGSTIPVELTDPSAPTYVVSSTDPTTCGGSGTITISELAAITEYEVSVDNGSTGNALTSDGSGEITLNQPAGSYDLVVSLAGCQGESASVILTDPSAPIYTVSGTDPTTCGGNGTILISTLTPSTSYEVSTDGGTNTSTLSSDVNGEISLTPVAGTYNVVLLLAGCTGSTIPVELTDPSAPTYVVSSTDPTTCGGSGTITISELAAITEYEVSVDNGSTGNALTSDGSGEITLNQPAGSYDLVVSLAGCQGESASVILTDPSAPIYTVSGTDPTTCGGNGTILISTLTPSTSYEVSTDGGTNTSTLSSDVNGEISLIPVAGTYNVVLLLAGCTGSTIPVELTDPSAPTYVVSSTDPTTCGGSGTITISELTASTQYEVSLDNGVTGNAFTSDGSGVITVSQPAGSYDVVVSLAGCEGLPASVVLTDPSVPTYTVSGTDPTTCGGNGTILISTLTPSTSYEVSTDGGSTASALTSDGSGEITLNQPTGSYDVVVSLAGCEGLPASVVLTDPSAPTYTVSGTDPTTCGGSGTIIVSELTTNTTYIVSTDGGSTTSSATSDGGGLINLNRSAGTYNVVLLLAGCTGSTIPVELTDPSAPTYVVSSTDPTTCGGSGTITISELTASTQYEVSLDNGVTGNALASDGSGVITLNQPAGSYDVVVSLAGCGGLPASVVLTDPSAPTYVVASADPTTCGGSGTITISSLTPSTTYEVSTDGGSTTSTETSDGIGVITLDRSSGSYTVSVSLAGCVGDPANIVINNFDVACSPVSYITNLEVSLPYVLDFSTDHGELEDGSGNGIGFTVVMDHSEARRAGDLAISCPEMNGYEPSLLTLNTGTGQLEVVSQAGIAYLDPPASSNNNNQVNTLGVGLKGLDRKIIIKTTLIDIVTGASSAQAGIWFGYDEDNFVKLNLNQNNRIEMRVERSGASENNATDQLQVTTTVGATNVVALEMEIDPLTLEVQAFYTIDGVSRTLLADGAINSLTLPADYFTGRDLTCVSDITFAGIYATHRNGSQFTARFDEFSVSEILSTENDITGFSLVEQTGAATINALTHTVEIEVSNGTDLSALVPTIAVSDNAAISPASGDPQDFSTVFTYTVTAEDGTTQDWIVNVTEAQLGYSMQINFQDEVTLPPTGYSKDYGKQFGFSFISNNNVDYDYGWKQVSDNSPIDLSPDADMGTDGVGRNRIGASYSTSTDQEKLEGTLVHFQGDNIASWVQGGLPRANEAYWELEIPNGIYEVTLGLGDKGTSIDSRHSATIEGYTIIPAFVPIPNETKEASMVVEVSDGFLTINGLGGFNSKITHISVVESTGLPVNGTLSFTPSSITEVLEEGATGSFTSDLSGLGAIDLGLILNDDIDATDDWLTLPDPVALGALIFNTDATTLTDGYSESDQIIATAKGYTPAILNADLTVTAVGIVPVLSFNPLSVNVSLEENLMTTETVALEVSDLSAPSIDLNINYTDGLGWITLPANPISAGNINIALDASGLAPGTYNAEITASSNAYTSGSLMITLLVTAPEPPCSPISEFACSEVPVDLPFLLEFEDVQARINDGANIPTGFTMVMEPSSRLAVDDPVFDSNIPGYEPDLLSVSGGKLNITSTKGIFFYHLPPEVNGNGPGSTETNSQINALGVGFDASTSTVISTEVVVPNFAASAGNNSQQGGLWFGLDEDNVAKLVVAKASDVNAKIQLLVEENGDPRGGAGVVELNSPEFAYSTGSTIELKIEINPGTGKIKAFYTLPGGSEILLTEGLDSELDLPALFTTGVDHDSDLATSNISYAGVFGTQRRAASDQTLVFGFDNFSISNGLSLAFSPSVLSESLEEGSGPTTVTTNLSVSDTGSPNILLAKEGVSTWLSLPSNPTIGDLNFDLNTAGLIPGIYTETVTASAAGYVDAAVIITLTVTPQENNGLTLFINFQDPGTVPPSNFIEDHGQAYGLREEADQGSSTYTYGWITEASAGTGNSVPLDLSTGGNPAGNGRNRGVGGISTEENTIFHMQYNDVDGGTATNGVAAAGAWEIEIPNGTYQVDVVLGDPDPVGGNNPENYDLSLEGVKVVDDFVPTGAEGAATNFTAISETVVLTDGRLTVDAIGGTNTKIAWMSIVELSTLPALEFASPTISRSIEINGLNEEIGDFLGTSDGTDPQDAMLTANDGVGVPSWLKFMGGVIDNITFQTGAEITFQFDPTGLSVGTYTATVTATAAGYQNATVTATLYVIDPEDPFVMGVIPANGATNVSILTSISANDLYLPNFDDQGRTSLDNSTITPSTVQLFKVLDNTVVPSGVNGTGGGDAISLTPSTALEPNTEYRFEIDGVTDLAGYTLLPFSSTFTTGDGGSGPAGDLDNVTFTNAGAVASGANYATLQIGPDGKLYGMTIQGDIHRWMIEADGTLSGQEILSTWKTNYASDPNGTGSSARNAVGFCFDPTATAGNLVAYVSHVSGTLNAGPEWDGNISRLSGPDLATHELLVYHLPRSLRDHLTNSIVFRPGENNVLYFNQGSNSAGGAPDGAWGNRPERLLSAATLRLDLDLLSTLPLDAMTTMNSAAINTPGIENSPLLDGMYNPYYVNAPLTIYGSGIRNAYDLTWHSNGQLYVPTNGTAGGSNSPASIDGTRRPNGTFYDTSGDPSNYPSVPASNGNNTQRDWLFRINPNSTPGYFGHPNPLRGEFVLNRGDVDVNNTPYNGIVPDINYRGAAFDFEFNKSPNGVIEYRSNSENGNLQGALLVVQYSGGDNIVALQPGGTGDIGTSKGNIPGFGGFNNPLDLIEDINTGNIYVSEYGGSGSITLLKPSTGAVQAPIISASPEDLLFDEIVSNGASAGQIVVVTNTGNGPLTNAQVSITGFDLSEFVVDASALPATLNAGESANLVVTFDPTSIGPKVASLVVSSAQVGVSDAVVTLSGLGEQGNGGSNEPSLQWVLDAHLGEGVVNVGDNDPTTNVLHSTIKDGSFLGDEVDAQTFLRAEDGPVTIEALAVYGPTSTNPIVAVGYYEAGNSSNSTELFTVGNAPPSNGQTLSPVTTGLLSFDPGTQEFGMYSRWPFFSNRELYTEDALNTTTPDPLDLKKHHVRVYEYPGEDDAYILATEEHISGYDFQDVVIVIRNVIPVVVGPEIAANPAELIFEATTNNEGSNIDSKVITISNEGNATLNISSVTIGGTFADQYNAVSPSGSTSINPGQNQTYTITYAPDLNGSDLGYQEAELVFASNDPNNPTLTIGLHGLKKAGFEGGEEPPLQDVVDALGIGIDVGWTSLTVGTNPALEGEELDIDLFEKSGSEPVIITPVARYSPAESLPFGWFTKNPTTLNEVGVLASDLPNAQTLFPAQASGTNSFDPGVGTFGIYVDSESFNRVNYTEDALNTGGVAHRTRIYPVRDRDGVLVPNSYLVTFEDASNGDYQDYVFVIENAVPANNSGLFLSFDKSLLNFSSIVDINNVPSQTLELSTNGSIDEASVTLNSSETWLVIPSSFTFGIPFDVSINTSGLTAGNYQASITAQTVGYQSALATVNLQVSGDLTYTYQFNFQDPTDIEVSPVGWVDDLGAGYGTQVTSQGNIDFGWVVPGTLTPASAAASARNRNTGAIDDDPLLKTLNIIGHANASLYPLREWVVDVPNGDYYVNISVGDPDFTDSYHQLEANGVIVLDYDQETSNTTPSFQNTAQVTVSDGRLRLKLGPDGGNVKTNYIRLAPINIADIPPSIVTNFIGVEGNPSQYLGQVTVELAAIDNSGSGIASIEYSLDNITFLPYTGGILFDQEGVQTLYARVTDNNTNVTNEVYNFSVIPSSGAVIVLENMTKIPGTDIGFPANDYLTFHRNNQGSASAIKWHNQNTLRLINTGTNMLVISSLDITDLTEFRINDISTSDNSINWDLSQLPTPIPFPLSVAPGEHLDVLLEFIENVGAKGLRTQTLTIASNSDAGFVNEVTLRGGYMLQPEGGNEIDAQMVMQAFGFTTSMNGQPKPSSDYPDPAQIIAGVEGDLILSETFVQADAGIPVRGLQLGAFKGPGGATAKFIQAAGGGTVGGFSYSYGGDWHQTLLPKASNTSTSIAGDASPTINDPFRIHIGGETTSLKNGTSGPLLGVRMYKVYDRDGDIVPNTYIALQDYIGNDGCGAGSANCDWNDNVHIFFNIRPEAMPTVLTIPDIAIDLDVLYSQELSQYFDIGYPGNSLTYSANLLGGDDLPNWITFDSQTGVISGTPAITDMSPLQIEVTATDLNGIVVSDDYELTITGAVGRYLVATPESLDFGISFEGDATQNLSITLENIGSLSGPALNINNINITGTDAAFFGFDDTATDLELDGGETTTLAVNFDPSTPIGVGIKDAVLEITNDVDGTTLLVPLTAEVQDGCSSSTFAIDLNTTIVSDPNCGVENGSIQVEVINATGIVTFTLGAESNTTGLFENLGPGTYSITAVDDSNCPKMADFDLVEPGVVIDFTITTTAETCAENDGSATLVLNVGNISDYSLVWSNGDTGASAASLSQGTYSLEVTEIATGCILTIPVDISVDCIPPFQPIYINAGGGTTLTYLGNTFVNDEEISPIYHNTVHTYLSNLAGTPELYHTERGTDGEGGFLTYAIPVPNGTYNIRTHHAELWFGRLGPEQNAGSRIFDIEIEGQILKDDLNLFNEGVGPGLASDFIVLDFTEVEVTDGELTITMTASANRPTISGIEVFTCADIVLNLADTGYGSLRDMVTSSCQLENIYFDPTLANSLIPLPSGEIFIDRVVHFHGLGESSLTISGGNTNRIFRLGPNADVTIEDLTIANGSESIDGGAILLDGGILKLKNMTLEGNVENGSPKAVTLNSGELIIQGQVTVKE